MIEHKHNLRAPRAGNFARAPASARFRNFGLTKKEFTEAAERWQLSHQARSDRSSRYEAWRLAQAVWNGVYGEEDAIRELSGAIYRLAQRGRYSVPVRPVAAALLQVALSALKRRHADTAERIEQVALDALERGQSRGVVELQAAAVAATAEPPAPPNLLRDALDGALERHRARGAMWEHYERESARRLERVE